jgi:hypothetical protein
MFDADANWSAEIRVVTHVLIRIFVSYRFFFVFGELLEIFERLFLLVEDDDFCYSLSLTECSLEALFEVSPVGLSEHSLSERHISWFNLLFLRVSLFLIVNLNGIKIAQ